MYEIQIFKSTFNRIKKFKGFRNSNTKYTRKYYMYNVIVSLNNNKMIIK
jgi:hypothetical protein